MMQTTCGHEVRLVRSSIASTYPRVILLGNANAVSVKRRRRLATLAEEMLPPCRPLAIVVPPEDPLPFWLCVVELGSSSPVTTDDPDFHSGLYLLFCAEDLDRPILDLTADAL